MEGSLINTHPASGGQDDHSGSPWDDPLPPEEEKTPEPKVVGSLEPNAVETRPEEKPVPFNIPENVGDEKVGKKIPAKEILKSPSQKPEVKDQTPIKTTNQDRAPESSRQNEPKKPIVSTKDQTTDGSINAKRPTTKGVGILVNDDKASALPPSENKAPIKQQTPSPTISTPDKLDDIIPQEASEYAAIDLKPVDQDDLGDKESVRTKKNAVKSTATDQKNEESKNLMIKKPNNKVIDKLKEIKSKKEQKETISETKTKRKPVFGFFKKPIFLVISSIALLLIVGVYMTELGVLSVGFEKVYGFFGIEQLWGGLSKNPEKALGLSALQTSDNLNFKIKGTISLTVNKTIDSPITSPLVAMVQIPTIARDESVGAPIMAKLTASEYDDYYDYYNSSTSTSSTDSSSADSTATEEADLGDQDDQASYQTEESTIKELNFDFEGLSSNDSVKLDLELKKLVGADEQINLVSSKEHLFVKTSQNIEFDAKAEANKWLDYLLSTIESENVFNDFLSIKTDSGFSITGSRVANEKVRKTRCYKYEIDSLEIGDSLKDLGIDKEIVQKISGDIWISIKDKTIRKVSVSIIPSISSSISRADIEFELYDFGVENSVLIPTTSEIVNISSTTPVVADTSEDLTTTLSNDDQRKDDLKTIKTALNAYKEAHGGYPKSLELDKLNLSSSPTRTALVAYLKEMPVDPKASSGWYYAYVSDGSTFKLSARVEDTSDPETTKVGGVRLYYLTD